MNVARRSAVGLPELRECGPTLRRRSSLNCTNVARRSAVGLPFQPIRSRVQRQPPQRRQLHRVLLIPSTASRRALHFLPSVRETSSK
jgi:hypothetical protein